MILSLAATLVHARPADADDEARAKEIGGRARVLATEGASNEDRSKLEEAIVLYKQAFGIDPNPIYQCNAGVAYKLIGDLPRAHALLAQCLQRLPAVQSSAVAPFRAQLDEVEAALPERHVAVDVITVPAGATLAVSTLAADERLVAPTVVWLPVGTHSVAATATGYQRATEEVSIAAVDITSHAKKRVRLSLTEKVGDTAVPAPRTVEGAAPQRSGGSGRTAAKITLGAGVLLAAGGGVFHALAYRTKNDIGATASDDEADLVDKLETQRAVSYSLYGLGAAALVTGAVLFYLSPKHADRIAIAPAPAGDGAVVWLDLSP